MILQVAKVKNSETAAAVRYLDGSVHLTEVGAAVVGELTPMSKEESTAFFLAGTDAFRRRREQAIAEGRLQSNGKPW